MTRDLGGPPLPSAIFAAVGGPIADWVAHVLSPAVTPHLITDAAATAFVPPSTWLSRPDHRATTPTNSEGIP